MTPLKQLTRREWEVLEHLLQGRSNKQIALALDISIRTVEFHLKNIYTKHEVASRVELILKLGQPTGLVESEKPGESTVAPPLPSAENGSRPAPFRGRAAAYKNAETYMKNLFTRYSAVGVTAALLAGLLWVLFLRSVGNMSPEEVSLWIVPMLIAWTGIGAAAGWAGKRFGGSLIRVAASALAATAISPLAVLPLMGFVVVPVAKLLEQMGLFDASTMSRETGSMLAVIAMLLLWLVLGAAAAGLLSMLTLRRPGQELPNTSAQT